MGLRELGWQDGQQISVEGSIDKIRFRNEVDGFAIVLLALRQHGVTLPVRGSLGEIRVGQTLRVEGTFVIHEKYGPQISVTRAIPVPPTGREGVLAYLETFDGIGEVIAWRLVDLYGELAVDEVCRDPQGAARTVKGLSERTALALRDEVEKNKERHAVLQALFAMGLTATFAERCWKAWNNNAAEKIHADPYILAREIDRIGFVMADGIAIGLGMEPGDMRRRVAAIEHVLHEAATSGLTYEEDGRKKYTGSGHCYLEGTVLLGAVHSLIGQDEQAIADAVEVMINKGMAHLEDNRVFSMHYYRCEKNVADHVVRIASGRIQPVEVDFDTVGNLKMVNEQTNAVRAACQAAFSVITGPPGSGKTTIVRAVVAACRSKHLSVKLAAPTGRAAKRLSESTGEAAATIHRMLGYRPTDGFAHNANNLLPADVVIVDEASMIDVRLMNSLLDAVARGTRVVLVGDVNQLPSVGPGQVLYDIIESGKVPVSRLVQIHRQADGGEICKAAVNILNGRMPEQTSEDGEVLIRNVDGDEDRDSETTAAEAARAFVVETAAALAEDHSFLDKLRVISPMNKGECGTVALNIAIQGAVNQNKTGEMSRGDKKAPLRVGDPILQTRNNYDLGIMNGDVGAIEAIERDDKNKKIAIHAIFDEQKVIIDKREDISDLELAYAMSVHKCQGSESDIVIMVLLSEHYMMLKRNLFYTGFTRAKKSILLVTSDKAMKIAVSRLDTSTRNTRLRYRIVEAFGRL